MRALHVAAQAAVIPLPGEMRADTAGLAAFENPRDLRRLSHFCRLALLAAHRCLACASPAPAPEERAELGLIIATEYGPSRTSFDYLDSILEFGPQLASPTAFSTSVHNIAATGISLHLGLTGPAHTITQPETAPAAARELAAFWLVSGRVKGVLLGIVDEYNPDLSAMLAREGDIPRQPPRDGALFRLLRLTEEP